MTGPGLPICSEDAIACHENLSIPREVLAGLATLVSLD